MNEGNRNKHHSDADSQAQNLCKGVPDLMGTLKDGLNMPTIIERSIIDTAKTLERNMTKALGGTEQLDQLTQIGDIFNSIVGDGIEKLREITLVAQRVLPELYGGISEEELKQKESVYREWGNFGWIVPPDAPLGLFNDAPKDQETANRLAMQYYETKHIHDVFSELEKEWSKHVRKSDIQEVKSCFDNKEYKACCMMLFSMLDAHLIRLMSGKDWRPSGKKAADRLIGHIQSKDDNIEKGNNIEKDDNIEEYRISALSLVGMKTCFEYFYPKGNNFKDQISHMGRDHLMHGMYDNKVTRIECIQLLLLYEMTIKISDLFEVKEGSVHPENKQKPAEAE